MSRVTVDLRDVVITGARQGELALLSALAIRAKKHWGYPPELIAEWLPELTITPSSFESQEVMVARAAGRALGFYALEFRDTTAALEHLWVDPPSMGIGVGRLLLRHAEEQAYAKGFAYLEIDSDPNAEAFYLRMGAERVGSVSAPVPGDSDRTRPQMKLSVSQRDS